MCVYQGPEILGAVLEFCLPHLPPAFLRGSRQSSCLLAEELNHTETWNARGREQETTCAT